MTSTFPRFDRHLDALSALAGPDHLHLDRAPDHVSATLTASCNDVFFPVSVQCYARPDTPPFVIVEVQLLDTREGGFDAVFAPMHAINYLLQREAGWRAPMLSVRPSVFGMSRPAALVLIANTPLAQLDADDFGATVQDLIARAVPLAAHLRTLLAEAAAPTPA